MLALIAFAANSLLCRMALTSSAIDPASFTTIRLSAGALVLGMLSQLRSNRSPARPSWPAAGMLALYAICFSFAYRHLTAGTGALLLFGAVQLTMITGGIRAGKRPTLPQWLGLLVALGGLVYLVFPGLAAPPFAAAALMIGAGLSWGVYSLLGRSSSDPLAQTTTNFVRALPLVAVVSLATLSGASMDLRGALLAAASGALASGLGYVLWYRALPSLAPVVASMVQLAVPPLAALGGVTLIREPLTQRLVCASIIVLGGIVAAIWPGRRREVAESLS